MKLLTSTLIFCLCLSGLFNAQLILKDLTSQAYEIGQIMNIEWTASADLLNSDALMTIDLINERPEVMNESFLVAAEVSVDQLSFSWTIPRFLKSSGEYHLRIYLRGKSVPKGPSDSGFGKSLNIVNPNPTRQSTLNLLEPTGSADGSNLESTCLLGEQCNIVWDYPDWAESAMPRTVDIKLYSGNRVVLVLAQNVPVTLKTFLWRVPVNTPVEKDPVHVVISASDKNIQNLSPGQSFYLASSGYPFILESRADREARRLSNSKPTDFTAPGPIHVVNESNPSNGGLDDVPRPTYAGGQPASGSSSSSSSSDSISLKPMIFISSILILFISFL